MSLINISDLTFAYEGSYDNVFEDVSFQIDSDWKLGFVGRNGRGKTTFLNLLLGKYEYRGRISASVTFEYFPYPVDDMGRTAAEIAEGILPGLEDWRLVRELTLLDMDEETLFRPFETLSSGERTKVLLALLFLRENSFLLIDEPTNHLDAAARACVGSYLAKKRGFILVSHDRAFLDGCVDHIMSINRADIEIQKGSFSSWWENKRRRDEFEQQENERLKSDIKRLNDAAKRTSDWSDKVEKSKRAGMDSSGLRPDRGYIGHKSAKMMQRSKAIETRREAAAEEKSKLLKNIETVESLKLYPQTYHSRRLLFLDGVSLFYGAARVCDQVTFTVERGERVALRGKNGSGKSSILKLICGEQMSYTGNFARGSGLTVSWVRQDTGFLKGSIDAFTESLNIDGTLFRAILRKLDFARTQFEKDMSDYSEGQKKKALIAASLCQRAHLYVWDEPLNFIDVFSRMQIEQLILDYQPTLLFVEHDGAFVEKIATKTIDLP